MVETLTMGKSRYSGCRTCSSPVFSGMAPKGMKKPIRTRRLRIPTVIRQNSEPFPRHLQTRESCEKDWVEELPRKPGAKNNSLVLFDLTNPDNFRCAEIVLKIFSHSMIVDDEIAKATVRTRAIETSLRVASGWMQEPSPTMNAWGGFRSGISIRTGAAGQASPWL